MDVTMDSAGFRGILPNFITVVMVAVVVMVITVATIMMDMVVISVMLI